MKKAALYLSLMFTVLSSINCFGQNSSKKILQDYQKLSGSWVGTLTYLDYSSGKPYTMPANLDIKRIANTNSFVFSNIYPNETSANSSDTLKVSKDGKNLNAEIIKSRTHLTNGDVVIITEEKGKDGNDNRTATFRHTYSLSKNTFKNKKEVQFTGEKNWIKRHEYEYRRTTEK